ncbi:MAG TPA: chemotaxis protein CheW [Caulobacteraceae bacterium]|nr:chemotaxis protein CheW [Caulobacteraceae bacterium]
MSEAPSTLAGRAEELRRAFDRAFAEEVRGEAVRTEDLLAFRVEAEPYALRLSEIAGLYANRMITRLPGGATASLGLASFRGAIAAVYDLHALLGRRTAERPRWLVMMRTAPVALAFETFEGHLRIRRDAIVAQDAGPRSRPLIQEFASIDGLVRPIVHLPAALDAIRNLLPRPNVREEQ